eukprot:7174421-Pyramimonas_sp.AAC.1
MSCVAILDLYIAISHSNDDLTPVGITSYNRERAIPASPVVQRSCGATICNQISFTVLLCMPCVSPVLEKGQTSLLAVRDPEQAGQEALPVAVQTKHCMETPQRRR